MKKILGIGLLLLLALVPAGFAAETATSVLTVDVLNYQPTPAQPGDLLDVWIQVANTGEKPIEDVSVSLRESNAFMPEGQTTFTIPELRARDSYVAKFKVKVAPDASNGERILTAVARQRGIEDQEHYLSITISDDDAAVFITSVKTTPSVVEPGREIDVALNIENLASARLRDLTVALDLTNTPFVPVGGTANAKLTTLAPQGKSILHFNLVAKPSATADVYEIPVAIEFLDEQGNAVEQDNTIGLAINTEAVTKAYLDGVVRQGDNVELTVRIVNKGLSEVKFVEAVFSDGEGYSIDSADKEVYVGNIDSDDWETLRVRISATSDNVQVPVTYTYRDAFNNENTGEATFSVEIPKQEASGPSLTTIILVLVVIALLVWIVVRRRKNKKRK